MHRAPQCLQSFVKNHSFSSIEYPDDVEEFGDQLSAYWKFLQSEWRLDSSLRKPNAKPNILYNDNLSLPKSENWDKLGVGGVSGYGLLLVGVAIWAECVEKNPRLRRVSHAVTRTVHDMNEVLEMMVRYFEKKRDAKLLEGGKRKAAEVASGDARRTKKSRTGKENLVTQENA